MSARPGANKNQTIVFPNCKYRGSNHLVIPFIEGDGVGPEVMTAARLVVDEALLQAYQGKRKIKWMEVLAGQKAFDLTGDWLPEETMQAFRDFHIGLKGPLTTLVGEGIPSLNVALRKELDLFACFRPVKYFKGAPSSLRNPKNIDIVLFRENTEDVYTGIEFESGTPEVDKLLKYLQVTFPDQYVKIRFPANSALAIKPVSREGSERIVRVAIEWALQNHRKTLTLIHKGNIMKFTEGGFLKWGYALAENEFSGQVFTMRQRKVVANKSGEEEANWAVESAARAGKLIINDLIADAAFEKGILDPRSMDVLVTTNLNGDYLSDALAALVGGLGIAPGANINFVTGDAIFEATHGTAPDLAGKNAANPCSMILSAVLMLRYMGWDESANLIETALRNTLTTKNVTADFHTQLNNATLLSTTDFTKQIIQRMNNDSF